MKRKRITACILAVCMAAGLMTGCGKEKSAEDILNSDDARKVTLEDGDSWKINQSPVTIDWFVCYDWFGKKFSPETNLADKKILEETGVTINFTSGDLDKLNLLITTDSLPDVITMDLTASQIQLLEELEEKLRKHGKGICREQEEAVGEEHEPASKMKLVESYIQKNLYRNPSMQECADYSGVSYTYFSRMFKEMFGIPYSQYVNEKRMEAAKELLEDYSYKVGEIAKKLGFDNPNHFSRSFYRTYGMYPSDYRKQLDGKEQEK